MAHRTGRRRCQGGGEARGHKRRVPRHGEQRRGTNGKTPVETGEKSGERTFADEWAVAKYWATKCGKSRRIAIGADRDLRQIQRGNEARENGRGADCQQWLVNAAKASRRSARQD